VWKLTALSDCSFAVNEKESLFPIDKAMFVKEYKPNLKPTP